MGGVGERDTGHASLLVSFRLTLRGQRSLSFFSSFLRVKVQGTLGDEKQGVLHNRTFEWEQYFSSLSVWMVTHSFNKFVSIH